MNEQKRSVTKLGGSMGKNQLKSRVSKFLCRLGLFMCAIFFAVTITYCRSNSHSNDVSIRLKWLHQAQFAGFYFAKEAGFYSGKGLNVTLRPGGIDYPAVQMVASGSDQFGVAGADQILIARSKGVPIVAIACIYRRSPFVLFSLKKSGIEKVEDFPGRRIGVKLGGNEELTYRAMISQAHVEAAKVTEVPVKFDISPLLAGEVDVWPGYSINEPISAEEKGFDVNFIWPEKYNIHFYADVLFTTEEMVRTKPEIVKSVVEATLDGWRHAFANRETAVAYTLKYGDQLSREHERKMLDASYPLVIPDKRPVGTMDQAVWAEMYRYLRGSNFITSEIDPAAAYRIDFLGDAK